MTETIKGAARRHTVSVGLVATLLVQTCGGTWWLRGQEARVTTVELAQQKTDAAAVKAEAERADLAKQTTELSAQVRELAVELRLLREELARRRAD